MGIKYHHDWLTKMGGGWTWIQYTRPCSELKTWSECLSGQYQYSYNIMPLCNSHYKPMCTAYTDNHYGFCSSSRLQACSCRLSLYEKLLIYVNTIQDPHTPGGRIILVHSLVPGGSAMRDGRLKVGDKLLSVNQVSLVDQSLQFAAQCLLAIQPGRIAIIVVCHSLSKPP